MASRIFRVSIKETRQSALNLSVATRSLAMLSHCKKLCFDRTCPGKPVNPAFSLADVWAGVTHYRQVAPRDFTMNLALFVFNFCKIKADSGAKKWEETTFLEILKFLHESQIYGDTDLWSRIIGSTNEPVQYWYLLWAEHVFHINSDIGFYSKRLDGYFYSNITITS